jgi:hypothetical protein
MSVTSCFPAFFVTTNAENARAFSAARDALRKRGPGECMKTTPLEPGEKHSQVRAFIAAVKYSDSLKKLHREIPHPHKVIHGNISKEVRKRRIFEQGM